MSVHAQATIEVLACVPKVWPAKEGKPAQTQQVLQCIVRGEDNAVEVGEMKMYQEEPIKPGVYIGTFAVAVDYKTKQIGAKLLTLVLSKPARPAAS